MNYRNDFTRILGFILAIIGIFYWPLLIAGILLLFIDTMGRIFFADPDEEEAGSDK